MQTTSLSDTKQTATATVTGTCPHCGHVEQFHGIDTRPLFFEYCRPFCGNCAESYLLNETPHITLPRRCANPDCSLALNHEGSCRKLVRLQGEQGVFVINKTDGKESYSRYSRD